MSVLYIRRCRAIIVIYIEDDSLTGTGIQFNCCSHTGSQFTVRNGHTFNFIDYCTIFFEHYRIFCQFSAGSIVFQQIAFNAHCIRRYRLIHVIIAILRQQRQRTSIPCGNLSGLNLIQFSILFAFAFCISIVIVAFGIYKFL